MQKESLRSAENSEVVDALSEKKLQKNLELLIMTKILSMRSQKSLVYLRNIFKKMQSYLRREACLHMHLPDVISPENQ